MLAPFRLWLGLATAAEGLNLGSGGSSRQADPLGEANFFDDGRWVEYHGGRHPYTWKLNLVPLAGPVMHDFDVDQFCEDLPGDVLLVGDSITAQHYKSLVQQACPHGPQVHSPCWYTANDAASLVLESHCCNGKRRITYIRNDWSKAHFESEHWQPAQCRESDEDREADGVKYNATADQMAVRPRSDARFSRDHQQVPQWSPNIQLPWDFPEIISRFRVFIFNSGVHYLEDPAYREVVQGVLDVFQKHPEVDKRYVFWRTTMLGVGDCEAMNGKPPFQSLDEAEKHYDENPWYAGKHFNHQNEIARSMFASHGYSLIDVYKSSMMNGHSGHPGNGDCQHYDDSYLYEHWNRLFYNQMRLRADFALITRR